MRVLVCGGRGYTGPVDPILDALDEEHGVDVVISGGARGADRAAWWWGFRNGKAVLTFGPDYKRYPTKVAPVMRNQRMLDEGRPDLVVAFPGGRGTEDMVERARRARVPVKLIST